MKTRCFLAALFVTLGCSNRHDASLPLIDPPGQQWATFEGSIVSDQQEVIEVELRLRESSTGLPSDYRLNGIVVTDSYTSGWTSAGLYEAIPLDSGRFGIYIMGMKSGHEVSSNGFFTRNIDRMRNVPSKPNNYLSADFYFTTTGDGRLTQSDDHFNVVVDDTRCTIYKRSNLFTIEGYVTVEPDSAMKFFERNTFENWQVAHLGLYGVLKEKYKHLATEPWEGIYVRALAYSVSDSTNEASQRGDLVVKKLISMGESPK